VKRYKKSDNNLAGKKTFFYFMRVRTIFRLEGAMPQALLAKEPLDVKLKVSCALPFGITDVRLQIAIIGHRGVDIDTVL